MKKISPIFLFFFLISSCKIDAQENDKKKVIHEFLNAIKILDTGTLMILLDTNAYYVVQSKERFLSQVYYINDRFKSCDNNIEDSLVKTSSVPVHRTEYRIAFCRGKHGEVVNDSFEIVFKFADYDAKNRVNYFELVRSRRNTIPTTAPPTN